MVDLQLQALPSVAPEEFKGGLGLGMVCWDHILVNQIIDPSGESHFL